MLERLDRYFRDVAASTSLQEAIACTSIFLDRPVAIIDTAMNHIGHSPDRPTGDGDWDSLIRDGRVPMRYAEITRRNNAEPMPAHMLHRCIHSPANETEMEKYRCRLSSGSFHLGGMMVLSDNRPFTPEDVTAMQIACQTLSDCLHDYREPTLSQQKARQSILCDLLRRSSHEVLTQMEKEYPDLYALEGKPMVVGFIDTRPGDFDLAPYWQHTLSPYFPQGQVIPFDGKLLLFAPLENMSYGEFAAALSAQLVHIHMQVGLSDPFTSFLHFKAHHDNARQALLTGMKAAPGETLYTVGAYRLALMTQAFSESDAVRSLCHPAALQLLNHDARCGTRYSEILRTYLLQFHNYSLASQTLFMHRNTLTYHLERIEALLQVDLDDPAVCTSLLLSLLTVQPPEKNKAPE